MCQSYRSIPFECTLEVSETILRSDSDRFKISDKVCHLIDEGFSIAHPPVIQQRIPLPVLCSRPRTCIQRVLPATFDVIIIGHIHVVISVCFMVHASFHLNCNIVCI